MLLLEKIRSYFGVEEIYTKKDGSIIYSVGSLRDLKKVIIPHFDKYPLLSLKQVNYKLFKQVVEIMDKGEHLTQKGLDSIIALKSSMNLGLSSNLKEVFPNVIPAVIPEYVLPKTIDPSWLAGFVTAEGCFLINSSKSSLYKTGRSVALKFSISQHVRDLPLMQKIADTFKCGVMFSSKTSQLVEFRVNKLSDNLETVIPLFKDYPILGSKARDLADFVEAAALRANKDHLTEKGLARILSLKGGINTGRQMSTWARPQLDQIREDFESILQRGIHTAPIEYPLIILFILIGGILLMSSSDVVTMFLVIELQSYGLYILCSLYCDSE
jgi:hypothetical protein